jgi:hypothetical protein
MTNERRGERGCSHKRKGATLSRNPLFLFGGADQDRTDDLLNAIQALSQLSYSPIQEPLLYQTLFGVSMGKISPGKLSLTLRDAFTIISMRCRSGEIGRRTGLKIQRPRGHAGSSPASGTIRKTGGNACFFRLAGAVPHNSGTGNSCVFAANIQNPFSEGDVS